MPVSCITCFFCLASLASPVLFGIDNLSPHLSVFWGICNLLFLSILKNRLYWQAPDWLYFFLAFLFALLFTQTLLGKGFVILGGGGDVVLSSFILLQILNIENIALFKLVKLFQYIYRTLGILLLVEFILLYFGFQSEIASHIQYYKTYVSFDFSRFVPALSEVKGLNSIFLGAQSAGMLSVLGLIQEKYFFENKKHKNNYFRFFWVSLFACMFLITLGGTSLFLFFAFLSCLFFTKKTKKVFFSFSIFFMFFLYLILNQNIFERMTINNNKLLLQYITLDPYANINISPLNLYLWVYYWPFFVWLESNFFEKILGLGASGFLNLSVSVFGDCSFLVDILLKCGIIWTLIFSFFILLPCIKIILVRKKKSEQKWKFQVHNSICVVVLFLSLVHYGQAINNAGFIFLFGLHYASLFYSEKILK